MLHYSLLYCTFMAFALAIGRIPFHNAAGGPPYMKSRRDREGVQ
jgi:hypothetical protein